MIMKKQIKNEIDRELSAFTFDQIDRERYGGLPAKRKEKTMKFNKKIITGIAAAAAAAAVTVTAGAVSDWNYGKLIGGFFWKQNNDPAAVTEPSERGEETTARPETIDPSGEAVALLDPLMQNAEITNTFTKYNARFDGIIYDGKVLMASVNLAAKDGTPFDPAHSYSGFFMPKGIGSMSGREWWRVNEDGTLQAYCQFDQADVSEETEIEITYHYVLCDSDMLKYQPADELPPEEVLDPGSITARLKPKKCGIEKELSLTDGNGAVIQMHITPISMELIYDKAYIDGMFEDKGVPRFDFLPKFGVIYGKDGEVLIGAADYSGGVGDETGTGYKGVPYFLGTFSRIIDVDEIAGVDIDGFTYGEIPE